MRPSRLFREARFLALAAAIVAAAAGGSSGGAASTTFHQCAPTDATNVRQFCLDVNVNPTQSSPSTATDDRFVRLTVTLTNNDQRTLTHPKVKLTLTDCTSTTTPCPAASTVSPSTASVIALSGSGTCTPTTGATLTCTFASIPAGPNGFVVETFDVRTSTTPSVQRTDAVVDALVDEGGSDSSSSPLQDDVRVPAVIPYESDPNIDGTLALAGKSFTLKTASNTGRLSFTVPGAAEAAPAAFDVFTPAQSSDYCFGSLACFDNTLHSTVVSTNGFLLWTWSVFAPFPSGVSDKSILVVHTYEPLSVSASAATDTFSSGTSYVGVDGVVFSSSLGATVQAGVKYFVVGATATSFKISATKSGKAIDVQSDGTLPASRIRVVGDTKDERTGCSGSPTLPNMSATAVGKTQIDLVFCDSENGYVQG